MSQQEENYYDVVLIGRLGIDLYSDDLGKPLDKASHFVKYVGGTVANTAIGCARYGMKVALITKVSADPLGKFAKDYLRDNGVDVSYIKEDPDALMGLVFAAIFPGRDPDFIFYRPKGEVADLRITRDDIPINAINGTKVLVVTGTGLSAEPSLSANLYAVELGAKAGKTILFNLDWRPSTWSGVPEEERISRYKAVLDKSSIIIGGVPEWLAATKEPDIDSAIDSIKNKEDKILIITRGGEGTTVFYHGEAINVEAFKVNVLKTLGAGDAFLAAFLYGYLYLLKSGWEIKDVLRFASAAAAIVVTRHSCSEAMPTYDEVMQFLRERGAAKHNSASPLP